MLGQLAAIGHHCGVAQMLGLRFSGFVAWFLWRTIYLFKLPRLQKKIEVAMHWTADLFFSVDITQFVTPRTTSWSPPGKNRKPARRAPARRHPMRQAQRQRIEKKIMAIDSTIVTAGAAVMGSLVGGLASLASTWFTQRYQGRRDYLSRQVARRETLYSDFISEAARLYSDALVTHLQQPEEMAKLWSMVARIRLSGSATVVAEAEGIMRMIGEQFLSENLRPEQIHEMAAREDPLKTFGEACRAELDTIDVDR